MVSYTIEKLLQDGTSLIKKREYNNPSLDVQLILSYLLSKDKIYLFLHKNEEIEEAVTKKFFSMVNRRNEGYPLQYMINSQEFMGLDFYIKEGVLVPRPDTEILVEKIINIANQPAYKDKRLRILDIGTGSGAIAVSLGYYLKNSDVTAMDVSKTATETAEINVKKHKLTNVHIYESDIFKDTFLLNDKYDIVVSNPPYIEEDTIQQLMTEVSQYEPKIALDGGRDGLDYYRRIAAVFKRVHSDNSILAVEIGSNQKHKVMDIFKDINILKIIECDKDLSGNDRIVTGFL